MIEYLPADRLASIVCQRAEGWPAAQRCCSALRTPGLGNLRGGPVGIDHLRRIYRIRLSRDPKGVIGADRLLKDLDAFQGKDLTLVTLEHGGQVFDMFFDQPVSRLVTCVVGNDRRLVEDPGPEEHNR